MHRRQTSILVFLLIILCVTLVPVSAQTQEVHPLQGKITIALQGAVPVPGAPLTSLQQGWQTVLNRYKELQPNVEIDIQDLPLDQAGEEYCATNQAGHTFADIVDIENCSLGEPSTAEIQGGTTLATNFFNASDEVNPYTGNPWNEDWATENLRLGRCQEKNQVNTWWGCFTDMIEQDGIWVNMDILHEYGYNAMPKTYTELYDLSARINTDGKYVAWDSAAKAVDGFARTIYSDLTMDRFIAAGGDLNNLAASWPKLFGAPNDSILVCDGMWSPDYPSIHESLLQLKRYVDAQMPGGGAAFFDPARDQTGQLFLAGHAAFRHDTSLFWANIQQAQKDGVLGVSMDSLQVAAFPALTKDDLTDKSLPIYFDGEPALWGGGFGDMFAPIPSARSSGEDTNVDLIVRDFLQFLSSPDGEQRVIINGSIPVNPVALKQANPVLLPWLTLKSSVFQGFTQPPGSYSNTDVYESDPELNIQAWLAGQLDMDTAFERAETNARHQVADALQDQLKDLGLTELPAACKPYVTQ